MKLTKIAAIIASTTLLIACGSDSDDTAVTSPEARLLETNAQIAYAVYTDSVNTAKDLQTALATFRTTANAANLKAAKKAWLVAREPYGQSEAFRFRDGPIDNEADGPEGDLNAWPLGEALIDYVIRNDSDFDTEVEVISNSAGINSNAAVDGTVVEQNIVQSSVTINAALFDGNSATNADESDVITGYHAIEFLLWGQDLNANAGTTNGTDRETAIKTGEFEHGGQRDITDFTTDDDADRRHDYLEVVVSKLISDLESVQAEWAPNADNHRGDFVDASNAAATTVKLTTIIQSMGTMSYGELAGERMAVAYDGNSQEDEHSCFSDNTHRDVWLNAEGVANIYYGDYAGYDSNQDSVDDVTTNQVSGYGFDDYLNDKGLSNLSAEISTALKATETQYTALDTAATDNDQPFDVLIMTANHSGTNPVLTTINALKEQSNGFVQMAEGLNLGSVTVTDTTEAFD
jgi:putative iron-regulated protein